jgi:surface antigen
MKTTQRRKTPMKPAILIAGSALTALVLSPTANADTAQAESMYLSHVQASGINGAPANVIRAGHSVCDNASQGASRIAMSDALLTGSRAQNGADAAITNNQAADMVAFAIADLCPGVENESVPAPQPVAQAQPVGQPVPPSPAQASLNRTMGATTTDANPFSSPELVGYCTYGAQEKVKENAGYYITALTGDAESWPDEARGGGWTVVRDAQPRSIVVFASSLVGGVGHVAWVDNVDQRADGTYLTITEMNYGRGATKENAYHTTGFNHWHTRSNVKDVPGMSYILIP